MDQEEPVVLNKEVRSGRVVLEGGVGKLADGFKVVFFFVFSGISSKSLVDFCDGDGQIQSDRCITGKKSESLLIYGW